MYDFIVVPRDCVKYTGFGSKYSQTSFMWPFKGLLKYVFITTYQKLCWRALNDLFRIYVCCSYRSYITVLRDMFLWSFWDIGGAYIVCTWLLYEKFEGSKGVIRSRKSKDSQYKCQ